MTSVQTAAGRRVARGQRERGIDRLLKLFSYLQDHGGPARLADLPKALDAPKSTIYDLVNILSEAGLLEIKDAQVYFGKVMQLYGASYLRANDIVARGREMVDHLAKETGETCELCIRLRGKQVIIHARPGSRPLRISSEVGSQIPIPWTASGRLMLSDLSGEEIETVLEPEDRLQPDGQAADIAAFIAECHAHRKQPLARTVGAINNFTQCLASPLVNARGAVEATICFVLPADMPEAIRRTLEARLIEAANEISFAAHG
ncbi:IclR family transcriptional regulator [Phyllobacterium sp. 0TCS1.6C]|uniref:IclR family transcriptional regulator n=1 Tax=unclassified Phyllobacterium TaxID=2638441 RepID=UPI002265124F|nr:MULTISPECIES: IclR family transcriptional regulator [unclassified Phyllobacterium]MCX8279220.1 IclR family transcriptional regulator [Phyllobacterium sp. 0TCS1.6C]MCX8294004.1 IclR family transcriptional regulator [Phyllobacterium sp. 0TCS1.6A]